MRSMNRHSSRIIGREPDAATGERCSERGLGPWIRRNNWLLSRLFIVLILTFGASTTASNFSYGLQDDPVKLTVEQINRDELPPDTELDTYVEVVGTPDFSVNPKTGQPRVGVSARYSTAYYYYRLKETGDHLLIQQAGVGPDTHNAGTRVWRGQLKTVGTVIFHDTTQSGLRGADLPRDESIPVIEIGSTPEYYRQIFPSYAAIMGLWILSVVWLTRKKNKPILGL